MKKVFCLGILLSLVIGAGFTACFDDSSKSIEDNIRYYCQFGDDCEEAGGELYTECVAGETGELSEYPECEAEYKDYHACRSKIETCEDLYDRTLCFDEMNAIFDCTNPPSEEKIRVLE